MNDVELWLNIADHRERRSGMLVNGIYPVLLEGIAMEKIVLYRK